jgi:TRAP-type C4-dicarboxylate transport system permease small subunit
MKYLRLLDRLFYRIEFGLLVVFLGSMVLLAFMQVVLRNFFNTGLVWADTIVRHLVLWLGFVGATLATREKRHIGIDAITRFLSARAKLVILILTSAFAAIVCYYLAAAAWTFVLDERLNGDELVLGIQTWVALLIIPAGYLLISFHFLIKVIENAIDVFTKHDVRDDVNILDRKK